MMTPFALRSLLSLSLSLSLSSLPTKIQIDRPWRPPTSMAMQQPKHVLQIIHRREPIANTSIDDMRKYEGEIK